MCLDAPSDPGIPTGNSPAETGCTFGRLSVATGMMQGIRLAPDYPIGTARLELRPLTGADVGALVAYRSREDVCRWVPFEPMTPADVRQRLRAAWARTTIEADGQALTLGVHLLSTDQLIGDLMLAFHSVEHRGGEIGWVLNPEHSGHGYATEASHAMLHLAFGQLKLHRVIARVDARNQASLRLADRLGMRREAHLIRNEWFKGAWSDEVDFAILEDEWAGQQAAGQAFVPRP